MRKAPLLVGIFLLFSFVFLNIIYSQLISPLYASLIMGERKAVAEYLKRIKRLPQFSRELDAHTKIYGDALADEVFQEDRERKAAIAQFERLLVYNAEASDVLYNLFILYKQDGNEKKAREYLKKAQGVDPSIKE